jgi:hypothetical protein
VGIQEPTPPAAPQTAMMPQVGIQEPTPPAAPQTTISPLIKEPTPSAIPQILMMPQVGIQEPTPSAAPQTTISPLIKEPTPSAAPQTAMMPQTAISLSIQEHTPSAAPQTTMMPQTVISPLIQKPTPAPPTISEPSAEMVKNFEMAWKYKDNPMARGRIESAWNKMTPEQKIQAQNWATSKGYDWKEMKLPAPPVSRSQEPIKSLPISQKPVNIDTEKAYTMPFLISESQIQNIPTQLPNIGSLPEPEANVVMLPAPQSKRRQSMINSSSAGSDVPLINSANPDNFYVLYSQLNYNVVM